MNQIRTSVFNIPVRLFFGLIVIAGLTLSAFAQNFTSNEIKAALVGHVIKNISWPQHSIKRKFRIAVYNDVFATRGLKNLEGIKIQDRGVQVFQVDTIDSEFSAHVLYISEKNTDHIAQLVADLRGSGVLVITENSPTLYNIMINLVEKKETDDAKSHFEFQINRPNILFEKLSIQPELVILGGSELDVAQLYRQTEIAMQKLQQENELSYQKLQQQQKMLKDKERELIQLEKQTSQFRKSLESQKQELSRHQKQLTQQTQMLADKETQLSQLSEKVATANQQFETAQALATQKTQELQRAEKAFQTRQADLKKQLMLLKNLEQEVENNQLLLQEQSDQLKLKTDEVDNQAKLIRTQNQVIVVSLVIVVIAIVAAVSIAKLLFRNQKINRRLKETLSVLEKTQSHLIESEKMASLGQMVAGIAHELNTPLGISLTAVSTIGDDAEKIDRLVKNEELKKSDMTRFIEKLKNLDNLTRNNLERCHRLIQSFKLVSADQVVAENRPIELKQYVDEILNTSSVLLKKQSIDWEVSGDNPVHIIDPGILSQVINNLITNAARHAFEGVTKRRIMVHIKSDKTQTEVMFCDNGIGMDEETRTKIFEPFFTTKRGSGGTGLGMNIVHNLVTSKLNGDISISSRLGKGTEFKIILPKLDHSEYSAA